MTPDQAAALLDVLDRIAISLVVISMMASLAVILYFLRGRP